MTQASQLIIRPSNLERVMLCPGSAAAEAPFPFVDSVASKRGKECHTAMALLLQVGPKAWDNIKKNPKITEADIKALEQVFGWAADMMPDDDQLSLMVERSLDTSFLDLTGGKADAIMLSPTQKAAVIPDWKFGASKVEDPENNWQLRAYAAALMKEFQYLEAVEGVIAQPGAYQKDDGVRSHTWTKEEVRSFVPQIREGVRLAKSPDAQRIPGFSACRFCKAKEVCLEYKGFKERGEQVKAAEQQVQIEGVRGGEGAVIVPVPSDLGPAIVVNAETIAKAKALREKALSAVVIDDFTANEVGLLSKEARGLANLIEKNRKEVKAPVLNYGTAIDNAAKQASVPLEETAKICDEKVTAHLTKKREEARKAQLEAEAKAREAQEAQRKAEAEAQANALAAQEALKRAQEAEQRAQNLKTKAAQDRAAQEAALAKAEAEKLEAQRREQVAKAQAARLAEAAANAQKEAAGEPTKISGYRQDEETTFEIPDMTKVPAQWVAAVLMPNEKAIKALLKSKTLNEKVCEGWMIIRKTDKATRAR